MSKTKVSSIRLNCFEKVAIWIISTCLFALYYIIINQSTSVLKDFIDLFVQVNITGALAITALVASMGTFRWDHYRKALIEENIEQEDRKNYILKNAKNPLYIILFIISFFILLSILTLLAGNLLEASDISFLQYSVDIKNVMRYICMVLIGLNLCLSILLIIYSLRYMKELLYR
ncbi:hypothetical protein [Paenibacillus sp. L3-i20]|uniref:hypothetical protein n=1 Tax=Paenibacillus sp. L3-i20 TaxID=2905833 RepID=UPI001EE0E61D|nr:hypothetical protein [Paenibacillus sp. L3-i20]GKU79192.1 hypothetical protein L3i20_v235890 [Paenibacillus sp. L3-i20]